MSVDGRVQEIESHKFTGVHQNHINGSFHELTVPYLMGMSQYFYIKSNSKVPCSVFVCGGSTENS